MVAHNFGLLFAMTKPSAPGKDTSLVAGLRDAKLIPIVIMDAAETIPLSISYQELVRNGAKLHADVTAVRHFDSYPVSWESPVATMAPMLHVIAEYQ
jgi:hypothetical protein